MWLECCPSFFSKCSLSLEIWLTSLVFPDYISPPSVPWESLPPVKLCLGEDSTPHPFLLPPLPSSVTLAK